MNAPLAPAPANQRVRAFHAIPTPRQLLAEIPLPDLAAETVVAARKDIGDVLTGIDPRLLVVVGPCSVHDPDAALDYARRLRPLAAELSDDLLIVMRVYFEKPRTTVGWKGLINDPDMDETYDVPRGLRMARELLVQVAELGLPVGCEFLEPTSPQYLADAVAWGAIGARTTESQVHRQLASGLSMPIGFKNATDGNLTVAVDGVRAAAAPHVFFGTDDDGAASVVETIGNGSCHIILRGGRGGPNYDLDTLAQARGLLAKANLPEQLMIDCSHANSGKSEVRQAEVGREVAAMIAAGEPGIAGVMLESFIVAGAQSPGPGPLVYGRSVTDSCMDFETTESVLRDLAAARRSRR